MDHKVQTKKRNPGQPLAEYLVGEVSIVASALTERVSVPALKLREAGEHFSDSSSDLGSALAYGKGWAQDTTHSVFTHVSTPPNNPTFN